MYIGLHVQYRLLLWDFNETWNLSTDFLWIFKYKISWKSVQWETTCAMRKADGQTDMTKLRIAFRNFVDAYKNARNFLTSWGTASFSTRFLLHAVSSSFSHKNFSLKTAIFCNVTPCSLNPEVHLTNIPYFSFHFTQNTVCQSDRPTT